ncbi:MAG: divalent-cation tolerance protein CutA [Clostridiales bacterium]|jgi:periplasmic divalent cation tolerance protein|nr:divalent-cation tolerance protein CutA [Clostridiales bacterium]
MNEYIMILNTCPNEDVAGKIADALLGGGLAACVQFQSITSRYIWEGKIETNPEILLFIKTTAAHYPAAESAITKNHPYQVPEIISIPIRDGLPSYLAWISESTSSF